MGARKIEEPPVNGGSLNWHTGQDRMYRDRNYA